MIAGLKLLIYLICITQLNSDLNNRNDVSDLLAEANIGANSKRIVCCGELTLNTPYKAGLVPGSQGIAYINMANESYGTIMYIASGGNDVFLRKKSSGTWDTNWTKLITNADFTQYVFEETNVSIPASGDITLNFDISRSGYRAIGVIGFASSSSYAAFSRVQTTFSENKVNVTLRNTSSNQITTIARIQVLYVPA